LKSASPKKPNAYGKKLGCFHPALYARNSSAKLDKAEMASHLNEWLTSPGLRPPE
jgi:hypothetical protein